MKAFLSPLLVLMLMAGALTSLAQVNPQQGFIVTLQQDTLRGVIDYRTDQRNTRQCDFKQQGSADFVTYHPGDIDSYGITSTDAYYKTLTAKIDGRDSTFFASCLVQGGMSLYRLANFMNSDLFILQKGNDALLAFYGEEGMAADADREKRRGRILPVYNMLRDSNKATDLLWKGRIDRPTMTQIVKTYNDDVKSAIPTRVFANTTGSYRTNSGAKERNYHFVVMGGMSFQKHKTVDGRITKSPEFTMTGLQPKLSIGVNYNLNRFASGLYVEGFISWSKIGIRKDGIEVPYNLFVKGCHDTEFTGNDLHFEVGPAYRFGKNLKVQPLVRAGIDFNRLFGQEFSAMNGSQNYKELFETYYYIDNHQFYFGYYAGIGAAYRLSKGAILLYLDFSDSRTNIPIQAFTLRLGYEF